MRKAALGIGIGAIMIVIMYAGRVITNELSGAYWLIRPMQIDIKDMPEVLGDWTLTDSGSLIPEVFEKLGATKAEQRTYKDSKDNQVAYHGSVFEKFYQGIQHSPLICYPSQGWEVIDRSVQDIPLPDGSTLHAYLVDFEKEGAKALVLYWFQYGDFVVINNQEMRKAMEHYRPDGEWPCMVKIMLHMPVHNNIQDTAPLIELGTHIYEYTRTLQEGKAPEPQS